MYFWKGIAGVSDISSSDLLDWMLGTLTVGELKSLFARLFDPEYEYLDELFPEEVEYRKALVYKVKELFPSTAEDLLPEHVRERIKL